MAPTPLIWCWISWESGNVPEYHVMDGGIITVNTETAAALGIDYAAFSDMASQVVEVTTQQ